MTEENRQKNHDDEGLADKTEKWWDATRKTLNQAGFKATQYKRIVQKKIDLAAIHKKIDHAHGDLGKLVDEAYDTGETDIFGRSDIRLLLERLDELKHNAATLEHEIAMIKVAHPQEEQPSEKAAGDETREGSGEPPQGQEEKKEE